MFDIAVIGGGPVGLYAAALCKNMGYKIAVFEEDREIGKPLRCSGLISGNIRKFLPRIEKWGVIENEVDAAILHSKRSELMLEKRKAAYVINRSLFDKKLSESVERDIILGCRVIGLDVLKNGTRIHTNKGIFESEMALVCNGPNSTVGRRFSGSMQIVKGLMAIKQEKNCAKNVDLYFDKELLGDGFFWKIPRGQTTEYGIWGRRVKFADVEKFFGIKNYEKFAGMIPVTPVKKSYSERLLLVGGAAGQSKPWSGGGVIYGLTCAEMAAKIVEKAFRFNDFGESVLKEYELLWRRRIGKQIKFGIALRKFLERSSNLQLDIAFRTGSLLNYSWMDMDFIF